MNTRTLSRNAAFLLVATLAATQSIAEPPMSIDWYTIDCGGAGSNNPSTGGAFSLVGTIGQSNAGGAMAGGTYSLAGGFWAAGGGPPPCPGDFNRSGSVNSQDFFDFLTAFFAFTPGADFNHDGAINSQDLFDFITAFFGGC